MSLTKTAIAVNVCEYSWLRLLLSGLKTWRGLLTLNYHRIGRAGTSPFDPELFSATQEGFDAQVRFLKKRLDIVVPDDLEDVRRQRRGRFAMITFDDGYTDNFSAALPVLRAHDARATFFVATGFLDRPRVPWWDEIAWMTRVATTVRITLEPWSRAPIVLDPARLDAAQIQLNRLYRKVAPGSREEFLDALGRATGRGRCAGPEARGLWMTWDMVRQLHAAGMVIGGHTHEHVRLSEEPPERQAVELETCLSRIEHEVGTRPDAVSYPYGSRDSFDQNTRECLERAGVRYAFSYYGGYSRFADWDPYDIPRVAVERYHGDPHFRCVTALPALLA